MRKFVCLILLVCSFSFGGLADELTSADGIASFSFYTNIHDDVNLSLLGGKKIAEGLYIYGQSFNFHMVRDRKDSCTRVGAAHVLHSIAVPLAFYDLCNPSSHAIYAYYAMALVLNPSLEYFVWRKHVPISVGVGYNADWFAFKSRRKFYFRVHGDASIDFPCVRVKASYSYSFLNTYDLKKGFSFYLGVDLFRLPLPSGFYSSKTI